MKRIEDKKRMQFNFFQQALIIYTASKIVIDGLLRLLLPKQSNCETQNCKRFYLNLHRSVKMIVTSSKNLQQ